MSCLQDSGLLLQSNTAADKQASHQQKKTNSHHSKILLYSRWIRSDE